MMKVDTVVMLSVRRWTMRDHVQFWASELAPAVLTSTVGLMGAAAFMHNTDPGHPASRAAALGLLTCAIALPVATVVNVVRSRSPRGFDVAASEMPAVEALLDERLPGARG